MADYDVVPKRLSLGIVTGKALVLSSISCITTVFPHRRIFEFINDIAVSQYSPSIAGITSGGKVTGLKPVGGVGPVVITIVTGDDDDDNDDFDVDPYGNIIWDITPVTGEKKVRVRATDSNGEYTEKAITLNPIIGTVYWSDSLAGTILNTAKWTVNTSTNATADYSGSNLAITKTSDASTMSYTIINEFPDFDTTFKVAIDFSGSFTAAVSPELDRICVLGIKIDGTLYQLVTTRNETTPNTNTIYVNDGSDIFTETITVEDGVFAITRDSNNLVEFKLNDEVKHSLTKAGIVSDGRLTATSTGNDAGFTSNLSNYIIESPIGTPYKT